MNKLGIIIQARSGSKRFPKKIFQIIGKKSVLEHVISRLKKIKLKKKIIIATTKQNDDKIIKKIANDNKCNYFFGSKLNVLERFFTTAKKFKINPIVRICADSPFIDPLIIEKSLLEFKKGNFDLISNTIGQAYPKGMSVEIMTFDALTKAYKIAKTEDEKEHVTKIFYKNPKIFNIKCLKNSNKIAKYNFAVDYPEDLEYLNNIFNKLNEKELKKNFSLRSLISVAKKIKY